ncbi:hypothetical protein ACUXCC_001198 [Cytobacillus horneckiae]|uniref:Glyoxalase n=1 Tax=Cytobacillus horneckiae TaxID=549687 RepID=A0A2N0ZGM9_9BACI|nr:hypothetical protein [Cytobacillus horneckiae]MBN6886515.1 hypothetical protein [Cytobacillus horneckiae]PKG28671.1 hypothetical protein CWS20_12405 [Cytobacillus horneckiae]
MAKQGGVWFRCGIHQLPIGIQEPALKSHPAFQIENLGKVVKGELLQGIERFFVYDPFGNRQEFLKKI